LCAVLHVIFVCKRRSEPGFFLFWLIFCTFPPPHRSSPCRVSALVFSSFLFYFFACGLFELCLAALTRFSKPFTNSSGPGVLCLFSTGRAEVFIFPPGLFYLSFWTSDWPVLPGHVPFHVQDCSPPPRLLLLFLVVDPSTAFFSPVFPLLRPPSISTGRTFLFLRLRFVPPAFFPLRVTFGS